MQTSSCYTIELPTAMLQNFPYYGSCVPLCPLRKLQFNFNALVNVKMRDYSIRVYQFLAYLQFTCAEFQPLIPNAQKLCLLCWQYVHCFLELAKLIQCSNSFTSRNVDDVINMIDIIFACYTAHVHQMMLVEMHSPAL